MQPAPRLEAEIHAQSRDVIPALVIGHAEPPAGVVDLAAPIGRHVRVREQQLAAKLRRPGVLDRAPDIGVVIIGPRGLDLVGIGRLDAVGGRQRMQRELRAVVEAVADARKAIGIVGLALVEVGQVGDFVEVAAARRDQPVAAAIGEAMHRQRVRVKQADAELVTVVVLGPDRFRLDDRAHAVAEFGAESADVHVQAVDHARIEHAHRALQQAQVKGLVERQAVEYDERLVLLAAAHVCEAVDAVRRRARAAFARS